jgi:hypothetical protein
MFLSLFGKGHVATPLRLNGEQRDALHPEFLACTASEIAEKVGMVFSTAHTV